jgi:hypothetical protein
MQDESLLRNLIMTHFQVADGGVYRQLWRVDTQTADKGVVLQLGGSAGG